tara:strand:+ start:135 stop:329 length:195 start_codon:yes stop_codon:yes gene_type:complete
MNKQKIYWNEDTIEHFVEMYELNDFASLSKSILQFVIIDCDTTENTIQELFNDLITQVESKIKY